MIWKKKEIDKDLVREIASRYETDLLTSSILARRDKSGPEEICFFLEEDSRFLHNPFFFEDMEAAVDRVRRAAEEGERVLVFGDRDVDGITSTVLMTETLSSMGMDVQWALPFGDDPYGLTLDAVEKFADDSGTLIITVDCGISNHKEITAANNKHIDTIVFDHHNPQEDLPPAHAIINPKLEDTGYPFRDLCGCAVVSKFLWALAFSETDLFNHEICLLNILPSNEAFTLEAVKVVNFVEIDRITEIIIPGMVEMDRSRIVTFLSGVEIYVYDERLQLSMLKRVFGPDALISLTDIAPEVWSVFPALQKKSLLRIRENSRLARYRKRGLSEIDILVNLFTSLYLNREKKRFLTFKENLDLVALGTLADLMPLVNENRIIVKEGVKILEKTKREGLFQLLVRQNLAGKKLSTTDISWQVTPLINATGRMGVPGKAVELLLSHDPETCEKLAEEIVSLNKKRKKLGDHIWDRIRNTAEESHQELEGKLVLIGDPGIHRGITGILAVRLMKYFNTTAIVVAFLEGKAVGSLRSKDGFKVHDMLEYCSGLFTDYGGHDFAAGFNMPKEHFPKLKELLKRYVSTITTPEEIEESIDIDAEIPLSYMTPDLIQIVEGLEPYGQANAPLVFQLNRVKIAELELIGKTDKQHVRMLVDTRGYKWPAVFWNASQRVGRDFTLGDTVDLVFRMGRNYFQNTETLQLTILDVKTS